MKTRLISLGCWLSGIVIVLALYAVALAALDGKRIRVWRYESDIAQKPSVLFLLMLFFGWLILPWYVGLRLKILAGTARLKARYRGIETPTEPRRDPSPPPGLVQPWSVRWGRRFWRSSAHRPHER